MRYENASRGHGVKARYLAELEDVEIAKRDSKDNAQIAGGVAAGGAGLGYGAGPARLKLEGKHAERRAALDKLKSLPEGVHDIDHETLKPFRRAPGIRLADRAHTARTAVSIHRRGYDRTNPVDLNVFHDRAMLTDGAHRLWANDMRGAKKTPVRITHVADKSPHTTMRMTKPLDQARQKFYHRRYKNDSGMGLKNIQRLADRKESRVIRRFNEKRSAHGADRLDRWTGGENVGRATKIRQAKYAAAGGAVGGLLALRQQNKKPVKKRDESRHREPLKTSVSEDDARKLVERHGLKGPLPKNLDRQQRMAAYEARYVSAGGKKAEKWDRRARTADKVKTGALAVGTAGATAALIARSPAARKLKPVRSASRRGHLETAALATGAVGGSAELYAGHSRRKRASYASAPAGVAASALRRMQDYTP